MDSKYLATSRGDAGGPSPVKFSIKRKYDSIGNSPVSEKKSQIKQQIPPVLLTSKRTSIEQHQKSLPVYNCRQRILKELEVNDTVLIMSETGSGKTTQIPQFLLQAGYAKNAMIGITQPRRVAAITVARRVAQELSGNIGDTVGYTVRFEDATSNNTKIRFLTDGVLLRESIKDRLMLKYSVIILDEAHERTVNADLLFGLVKEAQKERRRKRLANLKVVVTSATMDIDHFGKYFNCKGMYLEGRTFPVRVMHAKEEHEDYVHTVLVTLFHIHRTTPRNHDVLIFLTGQEEIESLAQQIRQLAKIDMTGTTDLRVFTLYAQLSQVKQLECFVPTPPNVRKVILATNIAETSITIPGIRCVIDCGFVKEKSFNTADGLDVLKSVRISRAQAWQRSGRAGRDADGTCYRAYTKREMDSFADATQPEILRTNPTSMVLQLLALDIDCNNFDFLDAPLEEGLRSAYKTLEALGAIKVGLVSHITPLGWQMVQFPLDPKYSKLLMSAPSFGCMQEVLYLVSVLSSDHVFVSNSDKNETAALAHAKFQSKHGDHLTLLNVFNAFLKSEKPKMWCHDNFLNLRSLTYARNVCRQLAEICGRLHLQLNSSDDIESFKKCILNGFFENIAVLQRDGFYLTVSGNIRAKIHPSSVLHGKYKPSYILFTEIVQTEQTFLRQVTEISIELIQEVVPFVKIIPRR
ncbi:ATP-dependent RNA helicase DHX33 [Drosophila ficusphila]|uniref:ATP-dependent RNA helicase DHX33 n=1 Tax=Drosophila ficusphila TaxID=30025 RepID=UPI0007E7FECF|nr:ATP-dependent RNA helicase DHX33 [Drosophila ficusphila]XP_017042944.1 ATP-dependent RNA helicase DHX33 [Drosophila ficusphila]XP_017042945.1 ATP-dependent RNA helicase DHX33 [Drosophila ficusphila]